MPQLRQSRAASAGQGAVEGVQSVLEMLWKAQLAKEQAKTQDDLMARRQQDDDARAQVEKQREEGVKQADARVAAGITGQKDMGADPTLPLRMLRNSKQTGMPIPTQYGSPELFAPTEEEAMVPALAGISGAKKATDVPSTLQTLNTFKAKGGNPIEGVNRGVGRFALPQMSSTSMALGREGLAQKAALTTSEDQAALANVDQVSPDTGEKFRMVNGQRVQTGLSPVQDLQTGKANPMYKKLEADATNYHNLMTQGSEAAKAGAVSSAQATATRNAETTQLNDPNFQAGKAAVAKAERDAQGPTPAMMQARQAASLMTERARQMTDLEAKGASASWMSKTAAGGAGGAAFNAALQALPGHMGSSPRDTEYASAALGFTAQAVLAISGRQASEPEQQRIFSTFTVNKSDPPNVKATKDAARAAFVAAAQFAGQHNDFETGQAIARLVQSDPRLGRLPSPDAPNDPTKTVSVIDLVANGNQKLIEGYKSGMGAGGGQPMKVGSATFTPDKVIK